MSCGDIGMLIVVKFGCFTAMSNLIVNLVRFIKKDLHLIFTLDRLSWWDMSWRDIKTLNKIMILLSLKYHIERLLISNSHNN